MITTLNDKTSLEMREKYTRLFNNAYNDLKAYDEKEGTDYVKGESVFTDLGQYYGHMADYLSIGKPVYIMLPLDESNFHIDTNTREITVPTNFKKCGGVTNDNVCEIITFTVDRYFDFVDLGGADIHIDV
jgi:hypothetical protein